MGSISSGVGLVSGLDYQSIVDQLLAIDARPRDQIIARMGRLDAQRTAYADLAARISAMIAHLNNLARPTTFRTSTASSSNDAVLTASAGASAAPGAYQFNVLSLATTHQLVSGRFRAADEPLGIGSFSIESGAARVNRSTRLDDLNGGQGVSRGRIRLQDRGGAAAEIDLRDAITLDDVVSRVNAAGIGIQAAVRGDSLVLNDTTTGTGAMLVQEIDGGTTAADLGLLNATPTDGVITGQSLMYMTPATSLSMLRDGLGIRTSRGGDDFRISAGSSEFQVDLSGLLKVDTKLARLNSGRGVELGTVRVTTRDGVQSEIDLTGATTIADVQQRLQTVNGVTVTVSGQGLILVDGTNAGSNSTGLTIEDVSGHAARDLGIAGSADAQTARISGRRVVQVATVADVLAAINHASGNDGSLTARIAAGGQRIEILNGGGGMRLSPGQSRALEDLGLPIGDFQDDIVTGQRLVSGANSVLLSSLNGGAGLALGALTISSGNASAQVDLSGAQTLAEAVERIQQAADANGIAVNVGYHRSGTRLQVTSRDGMSNVTISGAASDALGLSGTGISLRGADLERRYVNENTTLSSLNQGRGVSLGSIRITNGSGSSAVLNLQSNPPQTLQDVIDAIGALNISVRAEINATGDGLRLIDESAGTGRLIVADESGTGARDLNIAGESSGEDGVRFIDGSYEYVIDAGASGTLNDLATRIGRTNLAQAGVLNDGGANNPFRLNITSRATGAIGELIIESDDPLLNFSTLTRAQDALVSAGGAAGGAGILITSSTNQIENTVGGLNLDLHRTSSEPVTIEVSQNIDAAIAAFKSLVEGFNAAIDRVSQNSSFNSETEQRGILLGEFAPREAQRRLFNLFSQAIPGASGVIRRLSDAGIKIGAGSKLEFDETKFREAYSADPNAVVSFFTHAERGAGKYIADGLKAITDPDGLLDRRSDTLGDLKESLQSRVDRYNQRLARKREQLLRRFHSMEQTMALLQGQQASLSSFASLAQPSAPRR